MCVCASLKRTFILFSFNKNNLKNYLSIIIIFSVREKIACPLEFFVILAKARCFFFFAIKIQLWSLLRRFWERKFFLLCVFFLLVSKRTIYVLTHINWLMSLEQSKANAFWRELIHWLGLFFFVKVDFIIEGFFLFNYSIIVFFFFFIKKNLFIFVTVWNSRLEIKAQRRYTRAHRWDREFNRQSQRWMELTERESIYIKLLTIVFVF